MALRNLLSSQTRAGVQLSLRLSVASSSSSSSRSHSARRYKSAMFCQQCEQTEKGTGCTVVGVCGKTPEVALWQDLLVHNLKGLSMYAHEARQLGAPENQELNHFTIQALFSTMTNVNFDDQKLKDEFVKQSVDYLKSAKQSYLDACKKQGKTPKNFDHTAAETATTDCNAADPSISVELRKQSLGPEIGGLQELITYGLKGMAAYGTHALAFRKEDPKVYAATHELLALLGSNSQESTNKDALLSGALKVGATNLTVMSLLDEGHTSSFGHPVPTEVSLNPVPGKAILVSGHDLHDLDQLLQQLEGTDIKVYTHGEMLPAHGYPGLKKYKNLAGHYGGAWQLQKFEFRKFPGPIVMTTNCLIEPRQSYKDRIYTANVVGWPGVKHIETDKSGRKDFSQVIKQAQECEGFTKTNYVHDPKEKILVGLGHHAVMGVADKVIQGFKDGHITRAFVIGGCDGNESERSYFKELATSTPDSSLILTMGCGKYRFNRLDFGTVPKVGLPRLLDMGQCNDAYGAVLVANALAKAFNTDINSLPLSFAISWFEQKAVAVLLTLLHLGVKNIALGPNMPAFVGPETGKFLNEALGLRRIGDVEHDLKVFLGKQ